MKKTILLLTITTHLLASLSDTVHSSVSTFYESKDFSNSLQKKDGQIYGIGIDLHRKGSTYKITYESGNNNTKKPSLQTDLKTEKLFLRYGYRLNDNFEVHINYVNILNDNIAITDGGVAYGFGITSNINKKLSTDITQFYTNYDDFDVYQSDLRVDYKMKFNDFKIKLSSITKYIKIDEKSVNGFTKNADENYLTTALRLHTHYNSYHLGISGYLGKRAFAIMNDGTKIQHHAMEFDRTYAIGIGKVIDSYVFRFQYIYQRATELPKLNQNVDVKVFRLVGNYKF